jgi:hypothetical protein
MKTSATDFRSNLFTWLDRVIATGEALEIERKGIKIRIERQDGAPRLSRLPKRPTMVVDPENLVHNDWSTEWKPGI